LMLFFWELEREDTNPKPNVLSQTVQRENVVTFYAPDRLQATTTCRPTVTTSTLSLPPLATKQDLPKHTQPTWTMSDEDNGGWSLTESYTPCLVSLSVPSNSQLILLFLSSCPDNSDPSVFTALLSGLGVKGESR
jgi:hypothetical protein